MMIALFDWRNSMKSEFEALVRLDSRLGDLYREAESYTSDDPNFCAEAVFHGRRHAVDHGDDEETTVSLGEVVGRAMARMEARAAGQVVAPPDLGDGFKGRVSLLVGFYRQGDGPRQPIDRAAHLFRLKCVHLRSPKREASQRGLSRFC